MSPGFRLVSQAWLKFQQGLMINQFKAQKSGNKVFSFIEVWNQIVPPQIRGDLERAEQLEQLFKYHATFLFFHNANELEFFYQKKWVYQDEENHSNRHYTNVVSHRNRFNI